MSTSVASLPNWRCRFDSGRPLQASSQVSTGEARTEPTTEGPQVSPTVSPNSHGHDCDAPHLAAIAARGDLVWRPGFGWVERPVAS